MHGKLFSALSLFVLAFPHPTAAAARDAAARGLDLFIHAPAETPSGSRLPVQVRVFGFPTVAATAPLGGATVEATWDPESLGDEVVKAPAPVSIVCDGAGRGHLDIEVPRGRGDLVLLVAARFAGHERTRTLTVKRSPRYQLELRVSDHAVVPGGSVSAWALLRDRVDGRPASGVSVDVALKEGALARFSRRLTTDRAGVLSVDVPIPFVDEPDWTWTLSARTALGRGDEAEATVDLSVREETPQAPSLDARCAPASVRPGTTGRCTLTVRDGTGRGIAQQAVRYWVGQKGIAPPKDDKDWQRASTEARTDTDGRIAVDVATPRTISPRGSHMTIVAKTMIEGHPLTGQATFDLAEPAPEVGIWPEFGVLVPGQSQRLFVNTTLDGRPIAATLALAGHGLDARVTTQARGWAEVTWAVPAGVGAKQPESMASECADGVAATLHVRWLSTGVAGLTGKPGKPIDRCVRVDRDAVAVVRPAAAMVKAGEPLRVRLQGGQGSASVVASGTGHEPWLGTWLPDAARGGDVRLPATARGPWSLSATGLAVGKGKTVLGGQVLVLPAVLPRLSARAERERVAPGDKIVLEAVLDDGHGRGLPGSVGAVVFDKMGGGHPGRLLALDTRRSLASNAGIEDRDVDRYLDGDEAFAIERWAALAHPASPPEPPAFDPVAGLDQAIDEVFREIVQSLEGGVFQASSDLERLPDVRLRTATGHALNPEMLTLVTQAMSRAPTTPGGEPWMLADLMSIDRQITYDNVARRVTRLKLFKVLAAIRDHVFEKKLDRDEPVVRDPNALLRRMVRDEALSTGDLLDPWGHAMGFVRWSGPRIPFLSTMPGFRLASAGPDGRFGTGDDVNDPFQRVLASGTPYAKAVDEDRLVDAKWDMRVGDETVEGWKQLLHEVTGEELGNVIGEAYGVGGLGLAGSGSGYGSGHGSVGVGRRALAIDPGSARWLPPVRTDGQGKARLVVPLGDAETTWQVVLVALPDDGLPATASVDVATALPLSVRVHAGATWLAGDEVELAVRVRNRTERTIAASLALSVSGVGRLLDDRQAQRTVEVKAASATTVYARVRATTAGMAVLAARVEGNGHSDRLRHEWQVKPAGAVERVQANAWVENAATVDVPAPRPDTPARGAGQLILERGIEPVLAAALDSLDPNLIAGERAFADALELFGRVRTWALLHGGESHALAVRARELARWAVDRQGRRHRKGDTDAALGARGAYWASVADPHEDKSAVHAAKHDCPPAKVHGLAALDWLALAPASDRRADKACWAALRASALNDLAKESDVGRLARAVLVFGATPGQSVAASALVTRLLAAVPIRPDGILVLPAALAEDRETRALVLAAIAGTTSAWPADKQALAAKLWSRLYLERDVHGGYGSAEATRAVVATLLAHQAGTPAGTTVRYTCLSERNQPLAEGTLSLPPSGTATSALPPATARVRIESSVPGVLARVERPLFRSFFRPVEPMTSPLHVDVTAPKTPVRDRIAPLALTLRHELGRTVPVRVRIPLPPGATLAEAIDHVRQVQGAIYVQTELDGDALPKVIEIPLRFGLAGRVTLPEVTARITDDDVAPARAPARPLVIGL